jgi:transaldolase
MAKPAIEVRKLGQSIWLDNISRGTLNSGEFRRLVDEEGIVGVTSNPTIFDKAISGSNDYDDQLRSLLNGDLPAGKVFEQLAVRDLQAAADILRPIYDQTNAGDGFVSWEVSPELANDTEATMVEVRRLWAMFDRPNAFIKIPGTRAGLPAIEQMLYEGRNINITLLFSVARYEQVMEAYFAALERRVAEGKPIDRIRSVASFFVSRVDTLTDKLLDQRLQDATPAERERLMALRGKVAIANAKVAYERFKVTFTGPRWEALRAKGAALQRPLWASTSTKDPTLPDTYYVDALIGPHTVNTVPPQTLAAFNDHGTVAPTLEAGLDAAHATLDALAAVGLDLTAITDQLEVEGVKAFADSFADLRASIDEKRQRMLARA